MQLQILLLFVALGKISLFLLLLHESGVESMDVIILSGQSNMAGRGGVEMKGHKYEWNGFVPHESSAIEGSILRLNADLEWEVATEPLHRDIDTGKVCGIGPGLTFAAAVNQHGQARNFPVIGLVPCAKGATSIREWARGSRLYDSMMKRTRAALTRGGNLRALLWYQGETDALSEDLAANYKSELLLFIRNVRSDDLNNHNLPFILVGITAKNHPHPNLLKKVREAQRQIHLPEVYYVDAHGLALKKDGIHLTTTSQVKLGKGIVHLQRSESSSIFF